MKILMLLVLLGASPAYSQFKAEEPKSTEVEEKKDKEELSAWERYVKWNYESRGYESQEEWVNNFFVALGLSLPNTVDFSSGNSQYKIAIETINIDKYKNNFYAAYGVGLGFEWEPNFTVDVKLELGLGGFFFDGRNPQHQGWLVGMDLTAGTELQFLTDSNVDNISIYSGISFRGVYTGVKKIGFYVGMFMGYELNTYSVELQNNTTSYYNTHGFRITPSIGIVF